MILDTQKYKNKINAIILTLKKKKKKKRRKKKNEKKITCMLIIECKNENMAKPVKNW